MSPKIVAVGIALALAGALVADEVRPAVPSHPAALIPPPASGALACPAAVEADGRAYLHLANLGDDESVVRITLTGRRGEQAVLRRRFAPGAAETLRLHGRVEGDAGAVIDHAGGRLVASHSLWFTRRAEPGSLRGGAAAACVRAGSPVLAVPHVRTLDADTRLVLYNPGRAASYVSVTLVQGKRAFSPQNLTRRRVAPGRRRSFRLGDFAFDAGELTAVITADSGGRVVGEGLVTTARGTALVAAVEPTTQVLAASAASGSGSSIGFTTVGEEDAGLASRVVGPTGQGTAAGLPVTLAPMTTARAAIPSRSRGGPAAVATTVEVGSSVVAGTSWLDERVGGADIAATESGAPALRWAAVFGSPEPEGRGSLVRAVLVNPGDAPATIRVRRLGGEGAEDLLVDPGRLVRLPVGRGSGTFAIEIESDQPVFLMLDAVASRGSGSTGTVFGFGIAATPSTVPPAVAVRLEPRLGVPAPLGQ